MARGGFTAASAAGALAAQLPSTPESRSRPSKAESNRRRGDVDAIRREGPWSYEEAEERERPWDMPALHFLSMTISNTLHTAIATWRYRHKYINMTV